MVEVSNETGAPLRVEAVQAFLESALEAAGATGEVGLAFVDEATMAELNQRYRSIPEPTDVLSFSYPGFDEQEWPEPDELEQGPYLGDIVVCPAVAGRNAEEEGVDFESELRRLLVHGALHLMGYDHENDRGEMLEREERLLLELAVACPAGLLDR
jgi:probable rRNA maturation factor